jgi:hypothetical protein
LHSSEIDSSKTRQTRLLDVVEAEPSVVRVTARRFRRIRVVDDGERLPVTFQTKVDQKKLSKGKNEKN